MLAPLLARHDGRLVKLIGDGALAVFDSVVDAVTCAAEIQKATRGARGRPARAHDACGSGSISATWRWSTATSTATASTSRRGWNSICEPGGVMVSGTAFDHLQGKVPFPLEFAGEQQVKNISRPVRTYRARLDGKPADAGSGCGCRSGGLAAAVVLALALAGGWWFWDNWWVPPANASIAVLPFDNLGGDDATGRLADGMTEDIITELTRFRALDVIARDATLAYKDTPVDVRDVGRRLQVRYILDGAIQRQGDRVRISARLVDAANAHDVWSERWDRTTEECSPCRASWPRPWRAGSRARTRARSRPPTVTLPSASRRAASPPTISICSAWRRRARSTGRASTRRSGSCSRASRSTRTSRAPGPGSR